jgi:hypothetical protein
VTRAGLLAAFVVLAAALPVAAQESVFNLPVLGVPSSGESMRARALGGAGIGLPADPFSLEAPAQLARFGRSAFQLSAMGQRLDVEDADGSGTLDDVSFPMGQAVFPAWDGTALALGFYQFVDFEAAVQSELLFEGDTVPASLTSEGGITVIAPAVAWAVGPRTALGGSLDVYLGSRRLVRRLEIGDVTTGGVVVADSLSRDFRAVGFTVSAEQVLGDRTRLGAAWRWRPTVDSEITDAPGVGLEGATSEFDLASEVTVGGSIQLSRRVLGAAVVRWSDWGDFASEAGGTFGSSWEVGGGLEITPTGRRLLLFHAEAPLRVGARWRQLPLQVAGEPVREWSLSLGYGRRFVAAWSRADLVVEMGRRGDRDTHGLTERFLRLGLGFSAFEQWRRDAPNRP